MDKQPGTVDRYGELVDLAADLGHDLATTQMAFLVNGDLPVEKTKELSHAIDLAARIQKKMLALAKANLRRMTSITEIPDASDVIIEQPAKETAALAMVEMTIAQTHLLELFEAGGRDDIMKHALEHLSAAITILAEVGQGGRTKAQLDRPGGSREAGNARAVTRASRNHKVKGLTSRSRSFPAPRSSSS